MQFRCKQCGRTYPLNGLQYKCDCNGLFQLAKEPGDKIADLISLGEVKTPIIVSAIDEIDVHLKLDYMAPTGSFKDRGARVLISQLKAIGIKEVVEDSSGNAGASIAGYCAAAGIRCHIYVPESTSPGKTKQISAYQSDLIRVPGSRDDTALAVQRAAEQVYYASHVYNPLFFEGTKSIAAEIEADIGIPDYVVVPAGNGTMLLGVYYGFLELGRLPRLIAVQSAACSPVYTRYHGLETMAVSGTIAEGIAVQCPARIDEMVEAIRNSGGDIITVTDEEVQDAWSLLAGRGIYVEPTASVAVAGMRNYFSIRKGPFGKIVVPLTGTGLKK
ncbi:MAG: Threonine synthase [Firmicutes bacterium]|nr:Threonine synthase [Bacillota bacterium]